MWRSLELLRGNSSRCVFGLGIRIDWIANSRGFQGILTLSVLLGTARSSALWGEQYYRLTTHLLLACSTSPRASWQAKDLCRSSRFRTRCDLPCAGCNGTDVILIGKMKFVRNENTLDIPDEAVQRSGLLRDMASNCASEEVTLTLPEHLSFSALEDWSRVDCGANRLVQAGEVRNLMYQPGSASAPVWLPQSC